MENSIIITLCIGLLGLIYIFNYFYTKGFNLTLDIVIFMLLIAGLIFHRTPIQYIRAFSDSTKSASGITSISVLRRNYGDDDWSK